MREGDPESGNKDLGGQELSHIVVASSGPHSSSVAAEADRQDRRNTRGLSTTSAPKWHRWFLLTFHWLELVTWPHPPAEKLGKACLWWTLVMFPTLGRWAKCSQSFRINSLILYFFPLLIWKSSSVYLDPSIIWSSMTRSNALNTFIETSCSFHKISRWEQRLLGFSSTVTQRECLEWFYTLERFCVSV